MTSEVAIINRSGIALAADSAVTVGRERVWKTTNKLFSLAPNNDIGIMIYGAGDFMGFPWETVVKEFRKEFCAARFKTVDDCRKQFFEFLHDKRLRDDEAEHISVAFLFITILEDVKQGVRYKTKLEFRKRVITALDETRADFEKHDIAIDITHNKFKELFGDTCVEFAREVFGETITKAVSKAVVSCCREGFRRKEIESGFETGLVFAGFGETELLPVLQEWVCDGKEHGYLRFWSVREHNFNTERDSRGVIVPFAQLDITYLFLEGISINQLEYIETTLEEVLKAKSEDIVRRYVKKPDEKIVETSMQSDDNRKLLRGFMAEFKKYRNDALVQPVMKVVASLPKEEMAAMAEALVELTSLRRKVDSKLESVAGPVDVAVISKGDGFIWIKRKHYFDAAFNRDFISRKKQLVGGTA